MGSGAVLGDLDAGRAPISRYSVSRDPVSMDERHDLVRGSEVEHLLARHADGEADPQRLQNCGGPRTGRDDATASRDLSLTRDDLYPIRSAHIDACTLDLFVDPGACHARDLRNRGERIVRRDDAGVRREDALVVRLEPREPLAPGAGGELLGGSSA